VTPRTEVEPVRWGILGTGGINRKLLAGARLSSRVDVVAVASRDRERGARFAAEHRIPTVHGSYEDILADPHVEAVYIPLPNSLHHPWTMAALTAGKHVLCEKPYSRRPAEVEEAFDLAESKRLVLSEAFMWRHGPQTARLLELLPEIGELQLIRATFSYVLDDQADIRLMRELDGGSLMDVGCYCVSGARLLAGVEPELVFGQSAPGPTGVDIRFSGLLRFPTGVTAEFSSGFTAPHMGLEAIGSKGSIALPDPWHSRAGLLFHDGAEIRVQPIDPYKLELDNVSAAIRGDVEPLLGRADALGQARTIAALYDSADRGVAVTP
jgi:predicted dehydrogenase